MPRIRMTEKWLTGRTCICPHGKQKILFSDEETKGLQLQVKCSGSKSWIYRWYEGKKSRDLGLGPYPVISLSLARKKAQKAHLSRIEGNDPIAEKKERQRLTVNKTPTFELAAEAYIKTQEPHDGDYADLSRSGWKSPKTAVKWRNQLRRYAYPFISSTPVDEVTEQQIREILLQHTVKRATGRSPERCGQLCHVKFDTARSVREFIETILDDCRQWRSGLENPAQSKFHKYLGKNKPAQENQPALNYKALPEFMSELVRQEGLAARLLEFKILTGLRPGQETAAAKWREIDFANQIWTVPAERMKQKSEHQVPLPLQALTLLDSVPRPQQSDFIFFSSQSKRGHITADSQLRLLDRMGWRYRITPHGMRRTLREWCANVGYSWELGETAIAHKIGNSASQAYLGDVYLERRRPMLQAFADYAYSKVDQR